MSRQRVTAAIIEEDGLVFVARRGPGRHLAGKWEFPGGKVEPGETPEQALARELAEELGIACEVGEFLCAAVYEGTEPGLELLAFRVRRTPGTIELREHVEARWVKPADLARLDLPESDRMVVERLYGKGTGRREVRPPER
ncbi:MAG: (deoxy)nucleoside triphosphate pyrophosphohydrolase [Spirochaetes bacterium]|nr:(deoxy)nucleoside triphosphate pyrophosphohydrolase [Spirochaetota bacterium]